MTKFGSIILLVIVISLAGLIIWKNLIQKSNKPVDLSKSTAVIRAKITDDSGASPKNVSGVKEWVVYSISPFYPGLEKEIKDSIEVSVEGEIFTIKFPGDKINGEIFLNPKGTFRAGYTVDPISIETVFK